MVRDYSLRGKGKGKIVRDNKGCGGGGLISFVNPFVNFSNLLNKMVISKFWLDVFEELMGVRGYLLPLQSL